MSESFRCPLCGVFFFRMEDLRTHVDGKSKICQKRASTAFDPDNFFKEEKSLEKVEKYIARLKESNNSSDFNTAKEMRRYLDLADPVPSASWVGKGCDFPEARIDLKEFLALKGRLAEKDKLKDDDEMDVLFRKICVLWNGLGGIVVKNMDCCLEGQEILQELFDDLFTNGTVISGTIPTKQILTKTKGRLTKPTLVDTANNPAWKNFEANVATVFDFISSACPQYFTRSLEIQELGVLGTLMEKSAFEEETPTAFGQNQEMHADDIMPEVAGMANPLRSPMFGPIIFSPALQPSLQQFRMQEFKLGREEFKDEDELISFYATHIANQEQNVWIPILAPDESIFWNPSLPHCGSTLWGNFEMRASKTNAVYKTRIGLYSRACLKGQVTEVDDSIWSLYWLVEEAMKVTGNSVDRNNSRYKPAEFERKLPKFWKTLNEKHKLLANRIATEVSLMNPRRISSLRTRTEPADLVAKYVRKLLNNNSE